MRHSIAVLILVVTNIIVPVIAQEAQEDTSCSITCIFLPLVARPLPTIEFDPGADIAVTSVHARLASTWKDPHAVTVFGEVENRTISTTYDMIVVGRSYNAAGDLLFMNRYFVLSNMLGPGERGPFIMTLDQPISQVTRVLLSIDIWSNEPGYDVRRATLVSLHMQNNNGPELVGSIRNDHEREMFLPFVFVTFYDAQGSVMYVAGVLADQQDLLPGAVSTFTLSTFESELIYTTYMLKAEGRILPP